LHGRGFEPVSGSEASREEVFDWQERLIQVLCIGDFPAGNIERPMFNIEY
jgi:hypothetical protein